MSVNWGDAAPAPEHSNGAPQNGVAATAIDPSSAWQQLAQSFPEWTLEPPLVLAPRRPPPS